MVSNGDLHYIIAQIKGYFTEKVDRSELGDAASQAVANNLTTTAAGSVLDARQGTALKGLIDTANTTVSQKADQTDVDSLNDSLENFGGRNYIPNSKLAENLTGHIASSLTATITSGYALLEKTAKTTSRSFFNTSNFKSIGSEIDTYTLSGWIYIEETNDSLSGSSMFIRTRTGSSTVYDFCQISLNDAKYPVGQWFKVSATGKPSPSSDLTVGAWAYLALSAEFIGKVRTKMWKLEKGSITTDWTPAPEDIQNEVDSINDSLFNNYGGTNLLLGTKDFSSITPKTYITDETYRGFKVAHYDATGAIASTYANIVNWDGAIQLEIGEWYTLSFFAKGTGYFSSYFWASNVTTVKEGINSQGVVTTNTSGAINTTVSSDWKRYWISWKTIDTLTDNVLRSLIACRVYGANDIYMCGVMFERGKYAHDWDYSPKDITSVNEDLVNINTSLANCLKRGNTDISSLFSANDNLASLKAVLCAESFVSLYCTVKAGTSGWVNANVIPSAYRPASPVPMAVMVAGAADGAKDIYARITTAGVVSMYISASLTYAIELYAFYPI